jgi:hypothetical protein
MAMRIRHYGAERIAQYGSGAERIAQYGRSRATLDATERRDQASIRPVSSQGTPWSSILA